MRVALRRLACPKEISFLVLHADQMSRFLRFVFWKLVVEGWASYDRPMMVLELADATSR